MKAGEWGPDGSRRPGGAASQNEVCLRRLGPGSWRGFPRGRLKEEESLDHPYLTSSLQHDRRSMLNECSPDCTTMQRTQAIAAKKNQDSACFHGERLEHFTSSMEQAGKNLMLQRPYS